MAVTASNAEIVRDNALGAVTTLGDVSEFAGFMLDLLDNLPPAARIAARSGPVAVPGVCTGGGTLDITLEDVAPVEQLSPGDTVAITFGFCVITDDFGTETFNGAVSFAVTDLPTEDVDFPVPPFDVTFTFGFTNFSVVSDGSTTAVGGGFALNLSSQDGTTFSAGLSGTSFSLSEDGFTATLSNFSSVGTRNEATGAYTSDAYGRLSSSDFNGNYVDFDTTTLFAGTEPDNPDQGVLVVTGAAGSTLTVTVLDNTKVSVSLDADGNGTPDDGYPVEVPWDNLDL